MREIPIQSRAMYNSRLKSYKQEMEKLEKDFVSISICHEIFFFNSHANATVVIVVMFLLRV